METKYLEIDENEAPADLKLPLRYGNYRRVTAELAKRKRFKTSFEVWKHDRRAPLGGQHNRFKTSFEVWKLKFKKEVLIWKIRFKTSFEVWKLGTSLPFLPLVSLDLKLPLRYGNRR